jgi:hypothetical protein
MTGSSCALRWCMGWVALALAACGGGGDSAPPPSTNQLAKYQGTWIQPCAEPQEFAPGVFGPASVRETLVISAPDATGRVTLRSTEDFFETTLTCDDYTSRPYASVRNVLPAEGAFSRVLPLFFVAGNTDFDILAMRQAASQVSASGSGVSSIDVAGDPQWRITFGDGKTLDRSKHFAALSAELALLLITVNSFEPIEQLNLYRGTQPYVKQKP